MRPRRNRTRSAALAATAAAVLAACAARVPQDEAAPPRPRTAPLETQGRAAPRNDDAASSDDAAPAAHAAAAAASRLPAGEGRSIIARACTGCHDLEGLWAYKGYYDEQRWRGLVETMIAHGARLDETETRTLVRYLVRHFGPGAP